jgi:hypothetical protein
MKRAANSHHQAEAKLPPQVRAAFARYKPDPGRKRPYYPRDTCIGIEYSLRVTVGDIKTEAEADDFADICITLTTLDEADVARGERVTQAELADVLELAEELSRLLSQPLLERLPS